MHIKFGQDLAVPCTPPGKENVAEPDIRPRSILCCIGFADTTVVQPDFR